MRVSQNTEYAIVGALIVYTVFLPAVPMVRQLLSSSVGVAAGIALVYWVAKTVSLPLALVVLVAVIRSSSAVIREHLDCSECPAGYTFNTDSKACKKEGATDIPPSCAAPKGMDSATPSPVGATGASK
jgi:hypothetical protein